MSSVTFVTRSLCGGGAEQVLIDVANGIARRGHVVKIICVEHSIHRHELRDDIALTFLLRESETKAKPSGIFGKLLRRFVILKRLARAIAKSPPQTALIGFLEPIVGYLWLLRLITGRHYSASLHIHESIFYRQIFVNPIHRKCSEWILQHACTAADWITIPSEGCRQDLIHHFHVPATLIHTVPNPIAVAKVRRYAQAPVDFPVVPSDQRVFVHVARLTPGKNHRLLVEACAILRKTTQNFSVLCIGDGDCKEAIEAWIASAGLSNNIKLLGRKENPYAYMARARALLLTSAYESFGLVLVEAMACGTCVIATDCPSGPSDVLEGGRSGLLVDAGDPQQFAHAMLRMIESDAMRDDFCKNGQRRCQDFDIDKIIATWENLLSAPQEMAKNLYSGA